MILCFITRPNRILGKETLNLKTRKRFPFIIFKNKICGLQLTKKLDRSTLFSTCREFYWSLHCLFWLQSLVLDMNEKFCRFLISCNLVLICFLLHRRSLKRFSFYLHGDYTKFIKLQLQYLWTWSDNVISIDLHQAYLIIFSIRLYFLRHCLHDAERTSFQP